MSTYRGKTFVGYLDISGFKQMMSNKEKLKGVMDKFYQSMFGAIHEANSIDPSFTKMNVVAVSDCAILFPSKGRKRDVNQIIGLTKILKVIKHVNRKFIENEFPFMTTCSIAYGEFNYEDRKEWQHVRKNCMSGKAYVEAFLDSRLEKPKIKPGQCRVLKKGLNTKLTQILEFNDIKSPNSGEDNNLNFLHAFGDYYYFYWMLKDASEIQDFRREYNKTFVHLYDDVITLLQNPEIRNYSIQRKK